MSNRVYSQEEKEKLIRVINDGVNTMEEIDALNEGLKDTLNAVGKEMSIKPAVLKKAVRTAHKGNFDDQSEAYSELENILATTGKI